MNRKGWTPGIKCVVCGRFVSKEAYRWYGAFCSVECGNIAEMRAKEAIKKWRLRADDI